MPGIAEDAFHLLGARAPSTVDDFSNACKMLEEARWSRLGKPVYNRLPNVAWSFSYSTTDTSDIPVLIREIDCESYGLFSVVTPTPSLRTLLRNLLL